jgi:hypothetical protein
MYISHLYLFQKLSCLYTRFVGGERRERSELEGRKEGAKPMKRHPSFTSICLVVSVVAVVFVPLRNFSLEAQKPSEEGGEP